MTWPLRQHKYKYVTCHAAAHMREKRNDNRANERSHPKRCSHRRPAWRVKGMPTLTQPSRRKQSTVCHATGCIHAIGDTAERQKGMKGLERRKKREKNARAQKNEGSHAPPPRVPERQHKQHDQVRKTRTPKGRRKQKNHKSMKKQAGHRKPGRRRDRAGERRDTRHTTQSAHKNTKEPSPTPPPHCLPPNRGYPTEQKSTTNHTGTETE